MAHNWSGNISFGESQLLQPRSLAELQEIVATHKKVRVRGSAHSFNPIADTSEIALNLQRLPKVCEVDEKRRLVRVSAQDTYGEFVPKLHQQGWALSNLASLPHISIAGSVATATHGSGVSNQNLASQVAAIEYVDARGNSHTIDESDSRFHGLVVGLGLTGVVTHYWLNIEPTFDIRQVIFENLSDFELEKSFDQIMSSAYSVSFFTDWSETHRGNLWCKFRANEEIPEKIADAQPATSKLHPIPTIDPAAATEQFGESGPWLDRLPHFKLDFTPSVGDEIQSEFFVARTDAPAVISVLRKLSPRFRHMLWISEVRTVAADSLWMSTAFHRNSAAFHFTWKKFNFDPAVVQEIELHLREFNYRPHWGKVFYADASYLKRVYPNFEKFIALTQEIDISGKFGNVFTDTLFASKLNA